MDAISAEEVEDWVTELAKYHKSRRIVTPVVLEFLSGATSSVELNLARTFVAGFEIADGNNVTDDDWRVARRIAERIPRDGKPRQLGDCLIKAIASRLKCGVMSTDQRFP